MIPEDDEQAVVVRMLRIVLPDEVMWSHHPNSFPAMKSKAHALAYFMKLVAQGFRSGWPDLEFTYERRSYFIEMKTSVGRLTKDQEAFMNWCVQHETPWALCRSAEQVYDQLVKWGFPLRHIAF